MDKAAVYLVLEDEYNLYQVDLSLQNDLTIELPSDQLLDESVADRFAWRARCRNINRHFLATQNTLDSLNPGIYDDQKQYLRDKADLEKELLAITKNFLVCIGLMKVFEKGINITESFFDEMMHLGAIASNKEKLEELELDFDQVCLIIILLRAKRIMPNVGVPPALLEASLHLYSNLLIDLVRSEGFKDSKRLPSVARLKKELESVARSFWLHGAVCAGLDVPSGQEEKRAGNCRGVPGGSGLPGE